MKDLKATDRVMALILTACILAGTAGCMADKAAGSGALSEIETAADADEAAGEADGADTDEDSASGRTNTADAVTIELSGDASTVTIDAGGAYVITGETDDGQIIIDTEDDVELILSDVTIDNPTSAAILVLTENELTITLEGENTLSNSGEFTEENDDDPDAVIYSPGDIIINGDGTLNITAAAGKGVRANKTLTIESGVFVINTEEGLEATGLTINGGDITINASDDGINASDKTDEFTPYIIINGGSISITMAEGDTDGIDSNGDITINGGTVSINGQSAIDYDGTAVMNGGTLIINGEETDELTNQFPGAAGQMPDGEFPADGQTPPELPDGQTPPELPDGERPARPEDAGL